jgi:hypothetical protein
MFSVNIKMTHNVMKLEKLLKNKGFLPLKYFFMDGLCFYVEIFSIHTSDIFFLYIPSRYEISKSNDITVPVYKITEVNIPKEGYILDNIENPENPDINLRLESEEDVEEHLEDKYKRPISLKDINDEDILAIKNLYRQVKRLAYSVHTLKYKLGIMYKEYMICIRRDNSISCFTIKKYKGSPEKSLLFITDLETLYEKNEKVIEDLHVVSDNIYSILEKNQIMHTDVLNKIAENRKEITAIPLQVQTKRMEQNAMYNELQEMLNMMTTAENKRLEELDKILGSDGKGGGTSYNLQTDINRTHSKARIEKELDDIIRIKNEISSTMISLKGIMDNCVLNVDELMFNSTVMYDGVLKNFSKLKDFC